MAPAYIALKMQRAQVEIIPCFNNCGRKAEIMSTDNIKDAGWKKIGVGLFYCPECAIKVGFLG
ncbi:hypothetical protein BGZ63DRAFT_397705 [Mariannaea sp. PMI_226]|nr:hypothetical protein BGZ63DRAFT_397705 [Mariannaea sp. PMI_226]